MSVNRVLGISDSNAVYAPVWQRPYYLELMARLSGKETPRFCYVGAANGDDPRKLAEFYQLTSRIGCEVSAFQLFSMTSEKPDSYFRNVDVIYIDGGSTRNLVALMREWQAVEPLVNAYHDGVLIAGASAGISMLFDWCISDSVKTSIAPVQGIGLLAGAVCAHYDAREERRVMFDKLLRKKPEITRAFGLDDGVGALFEEGKLVQHYSTNSVGRLHTFERAHGKVVFQAQQARPIATATPDDKTA